MPDTTVRLGVIVPSANRILEADLLRSVPAGVALHFTRVLNSEDTEEQLSGMRDEAGRAAWLLSHAGVRAVVFGCTSGSFIKGPAYDREVAEVMERESKVPCVTTSHCAVEALIAAGAKRVQLFTPYPDWLARRAEEFLERSGLAVAGSVSRDIPPERQWLMEPSEIAEWVRGGVSADADAVFISCTNLRALEAAEEIERDIGRTVVTSNGATLRGLLRAGGVTD